MEESEFEDERPSFWWKQPHQDLAATTAEIHRQRREWLSGAGEREVHATRRALSEMFIRGHGIEVGAGDRPFPIPGHAKCFYGDIRHGDDLKKYFSGHDAKFDGRVNAETFGGIADRSVDFALSCHVIEHLENPVGSIVGAIRVLKPGGIFILAVPDRHHGFDQPRPPTSLEHIIADFRDGGVSTRRQSYWEHFAYTHGALRGKLSPDEINRQVESAMANDFDIHFHCWNGPEFQAVVEFASTVAPFRQVGRRVFVVNENIFVLRKPLLSGD